MTVPSKRWSKLRKNYLSKPEFDVSNLKQNISEAISTLANYCINMEIFYRKKLIVIPKEKKLNEAQEQLNKVESEMKVK